MRRLLTPTLFTVLMTSSALLTSTAAGISTVVLPVTVPLAGVQQAANARVPLELARVDQTQNFLGGLLRVHLTGTVTRTGPVRVQPAPEGDALLLSLPLRAAFRATPGGTGAFLARDFGGAATVSVRVTPMVNADWNAGVKVSSAYEWTDPLSVELAPGVNVSVQSLVDTQVRAQLDRITADVEKAVRDGANLRTRAGTLWARVQRPWTVPTPEALGTGAYALVQPQTLSVTPLRFTPDALKLSVGATLNLNAALGRAPTALTPRPLPALTVTPQLTPGVDLQVPIRLPLADLSAAATRYAATQTFTLPVPTHPTLRVTGVTLRSAAPRLNATLTLRLQGPLGLNLPVTVDLTGLPRLAPDGHTLSMTNVTVTTRRDGLTTRVLGWLADARAQAFLARAAQVDLTPHLARAQREIQARLPFSPVLGVELRGTVGPLRLSGLTVTADALSATAAATGQLDVKVDAAAFGR